jgi:hypothetical protein
MVLGGENVAGAPTDVTPHGLEGLNEDGRLDGHVQGPRDTGTLEGIGPKLLAAGHEARHFHLGKLDFCG